MSGGRTRPAWIDIDGIVLLDKPTGMSSNAALQRVRRAFRAAKAGHTGSLDPLATGMLPVCLGEATKLAGYLLGSRKAYRCRARLGATTDTADADGRVLGRRPVPALDAATVEAALAPLRGRIRQRPPAYSALKQGGEPLYRKARRGEAVEVPEREVEVHRLDQAGLGGDWIDLEVECGSGTYVRSLVTDLGEALGCGAHVEVLRRTWVDPFRDRPMVALDALEDPAQGGAARQAALLPLEAGLAGWPRVELAGPEALRLAHGQVVEADAPDAAAAVAAGPGGLLGLVEVAAGQVRARRLFRDAVARAAGLP